MLAKQRRSDESDSIVFERPWFAEREVKRLADLNWSRIFCVQIYFKKSESRTKKEGVRYKWEIGDKNNNSNLTGVAGSKSCPATMPSREGLPIGGNGVMLGQ
mmetsp:Transcript_15193/g.27491  ORF Transcript_15193/g.27491 Transcript_15193/m.27491 type:complete len:102 (-) Transcript_15193:475-780(-)